MNEEKFVERREPDWKRLVHLCDKADASTAFLTGADFHDLINVYRRVGGDLALARTQGGNTQLIQFLNDIVARAYAIIHRPRPKPVGAAVRDGIVLVARTVRRLKSFVWFGVALFTVFTLFSFYFMQFVPASRDIFLPPGDRANAKAWTQGLSKSTFQGSTEMTSFYAMNNPIAAIQSCGIAAVSFGVGGLYEIYENAVGGGALGYEMDNVHKLPQLLIWTMPHGITELTGLFLSTGAGFALGWAMIKPGRRSRSQALLAAGKDAIVLLIASVILMFMAAPFEGYVSHNPQIPDWVKLAIAVLVALAWTFFWVGCGRNDDVAATETRG
jgi:uncharacterized membrane protein SpoIIM required for sporulation